MIGRSAPRIIALAAALSALTSLGACASSRQDGNALLSCTAPLEAQGLPGKPVRVALGDFDPKWRGLCITGRLTGKTLQPYQPVQAVIAPPRAVAELTPIPFAKAGFADLPGWDDDKQSDALMALRKSCAVILAKRQDATMGRFGNAAWQPACRAAAQNTMNDESARAFFTRWFQPWSVGGGPNLFTGYYELTLAGARTRSATYRYPLRALPGDMVTADVSQFLPGVPRRRITGRVEGSQLKPYPDRAAIEAGGLAVGEDRPLLWTNDPVRLFFLQIQGSGIVTLDDGGTQRVGYAGQNGRPYSAIGGELVRRGAMNKSKVSLQTIAAWLKTHPDQAQAVMDTNPSYVFFKTMDQAAGDGPKGAQGVVLTPGRSMAVDHTLWPYGMPIWVAASPVTAGGDAFRRLMVAQDTGGAIRGPVRGDIFWGRGPAAEAAAGVMKSTGALWLLLPKGIDPEF